jgi:hypothetical protein
MRVEPSAEIGRIGVAQTQLAVRAKLRWLYREQGVEDYGIDAQVELVENETATGKLLALQIKSGLTCFRRPTEGGWWFYPKAKHVQYWKNHSLPVVIVLYHPGTELCHWQIVNDDTLRPTHAGGWKLLVPEHHVLDETAAEPLREAAAGDQYVLRVRELQLARTWMNLLAEGKRLVIDIEEWPNKTSGRGTIALGIDNEDGEKPTPLANWWVMFGTADYADVIPTLFAWASVGLHEETYDDAEYDLYEGECLFQDSEGFTMHRESYEEWRSGRQWPPLRPYADDYGGEIAHWRLELTLNDLGHAFLLVDSFATDGRWQLIERSGKK